LVSIIIAPPPRHLRHPRHPPRSHLVHLPLPPPRRRLPPATMIAWEKDFIVRLQRGREEELFGRRSVDHPKQVGLSFATTVDLDHRHWQPLAASCVQSEDFPRSQAVGTICLSTTKQDSIKLELASDSLCTVRCHSALAFLSSEGDVEAGVLRRS